MAPISFTLDHNCLIALEQEERYSVAVRSLVSLHDGAGVVVRVVAVGASERLPGKHLAGNYSQFQSRLDALGIAHLPVLNPPVVLDVSFYDHAYLADDDEGDPHQRVGAGSVRTEVHRTRTIAAV
ncbi:MAG: hypothetical protein JF886_14225 [Candidatus Dormibacteraeota bacterium]|uniref:Uncharacterized protein n=1 Tax=Candidatus Aeolococcus gillhamiae TaxID=3127015 RepID=A0A934N0L7_9BACT|nr:hypothetical protein [Candidatus Dormibacteraeota bacterium]